MPDFLGLMKQATELKSKMEAMQAELDRIEIEGLAGGGMVSVKMSGKGDLRGVRIDNSLYKPDQKEIVEDLLVAAHADAKRKLEASLPKRCRRSPAACRCRRGSSCSEGFILRRRKSRRAGSRTGPCDAVIADEQQD